MAVLKQERHVELISGTLQKFLITSEMVSATIPAQLPHLNVFVLRVVDRTDAKDDVLVRIARLADLTALPQGRVAVLLTDPGVGMEYLSSTAITAYDTLSTGVAAATAIKDRVNQLILDWITFDDNFSAPDPTPALYTLPSVDPTQLTALINAYTLAKQDRYTKTGLSTEATAVLARASATYAAAQQLVTDLAAVLDKAVVVNAGQTNAQLYFETLLNAATAFINVVQVTTTSPGGALTADIATMNAALVVAATNDLVFTSFATNATAMSSLLTAFHGARVSEQTAASVALTAAQGDQITKAQSLASAFVIEAATLAAVLAICPDFDKNTIPFVPDTEP